ncbi:NAD(P)H-dependent oxidoreductase [Helicobacter sp. MIT 14-3879]|uniref:NAD(P)H-dependent oxidoreductase n=1 Tax=Helicobacter sp. MIT 14-3879 TaxID=2040649 RepID=UPI000E1ED48E|nr:NAD(P)H-dependent oxidoreductase [Helicobacter sp. MIT 14-3879]RDU59419.1 NAD(P)H-dependent oxidoreductase [Helicobacter sp. MIT 14-3879]
MQNITKSISNKAIIEAFNLRYACKRFDTNKIISDEDLHTILECARLSPSSFGFEPWKFIVLQNKTIREKLIPLCWGGKHALKEASCFVIILARRKEDTLANSQYISDMMQKVQKLPIHIQEIKREFYKKFQEKDFNLLQTDRAIFDWACKQTYIVLGNMMSVAALLGIDSCAIEGFGQDAVDKLLANEGVFDLKHFGVSVMIGFGYRRENPKYPKTRQDFNQVVEFI